MKETSSQLGTSFRDQIRRDFFFFTSSLDSVGVPSFCTPLFVSLSDRAQSERARQNTRPFRHDAKQKQQTRIERRFVLTFGRQITHVRTAYSISERLEDA